MDRPPPARLDVGHEVRGDLNVIGLCVAVVAASDADEAERLAMLRQVEVSADHIIALLDRMPPEVGH
jgi:hypothetical protein